MGLDVPAGDVRTEALRLLSNGVYVLTACNAEIIHAVTVSWVSQVSFQPPIVLIALRRNSKLVHAVRKAHRFAINVLSDDQRAVAEKFFTHHTQPTESDTVANEAFRMTLGRCPLLTDALGWLECRLAAEAPSPGDHALLLGEVVGAGVRREGQPMVLRNTPWFYGGIRDMEADAGT